MLIGLDLDGVVCDLGPGVAARIARRFGVATHPATWRTYDLRHLRLGIPQQPFTTFLDDLFCDPLLYEEAPCHAGAVSGVRRLLEAGWRAVAITARPPALAAVTTAWLADNDIALEAVHHTPAGTKHRVAFGLGVEAAIEDNPVEAEQLASVCSSWLLDRPYNRDFPLQRARRLASWDHAVGLLCQLRLFA